MKMLFFHNSDDLIEKFHPENARSLNHITYYWFNSHHTHCFHWGLRYFYLFIKLPKQDDIRFYVRNGGSEFNTLKTHYSYWKKGVHPEAPILLSDSFIFPNLILDAGVNASKESTTWEVIYPKKYIGKKVRLFDNDNKPINFNKVKAIKEIVGNLDDMLPFKFPDEYDQWNGVEYEVLRPGSIKGQKVLKNV